MSPIQNRFHHACGPLTLAVLLACSSPLAVRADTATWASPITIGWNTPSAWSPSVVPNNGSPAGAVYDVLVNATGSNYTVTLTSAVTVNSLTLGSAQTTMALFPGTTLTVNGVFDLQDSNFQLVPGVPGSTSTISNATIESSTGSQNFAVGSGDSLTLNNVTLDCPITLQAGSMLKAATLTLGGGTLSMQSSSDPNVHTQFTPSLITGTGTIMFNGTASGNIINIDRPGLTIGSGVTVKTGSSGGSFLLNGISSAPINNLGTLSAETPGQTITLSSFSNSGAVSASNGGVIQLSGTMNNSGSLSVVNGGVMFTGAINNTGTITLDNGNLCLSSLDTIGGAVNRLNNSTIFYTGTVSSSSPTVDVGAAPYGPIPFAGARVASLTLTSSAGIPSIVPVPAFITSATATTFTGVTLATDLAVQPGATLVLDASIVNNVTIHLTGNQNSGATLAMPDGSSFNGSTVVFDGSASDNLVSIYIPEGLTVETGSSGGMVGSTVIGPTIEGSVISQIPGEDITFPKFNEFEIYTTGSLILANGGTAHGYFLLNRGELYIGSGSTLTLAHGYSQDSSDGPIATLAGPGTLVTASIQGDITVPGTIRLQPSSGSPLNSSITTLTFGGSPGAWVGTLDIENSTVFVVNTANNATTLSTLQDQLTSGNNGGHWNGTGITSSTVGTGFPYTVAIVDNSRLGLTRYAGTNVAASTIIITTAHVGDYNLDGRIDISDLNIVTSHWQATGALWTDGDTAGPNFVSDGKVDIFDLNAVTSFWQFGTGNVPAAQSSTLTPSSPVPEPASLALLLGGAATLLARRRRRSSHRCGH